jgi:hypothetical protein
METEAQVHLGPGWPYETHDVFQALVVSSRDSKVKIYCDSVFIKEVGSWEPTTLPPYGLLTLSSSSGADLILASSFPSKERVSLPSQDSWCSVS